MSHHHLFLLPTLTPLFLSSSLCSFDLSLSHVCSRLCVRLGWSGTYMSDLWYATHAPTLHCTPRMRETAFHAICISYVVTCIQLIVLYSSAGYTMIMSDRRTMTVGNFLARRRPPTNRGNNGRRRPLTCTEVDSQVSRYGRTTALPTACARSIFVIVFS